jgi:hypothetical protein
MAYWLLLTVPPDMQQHNVSAWVVGPMTLGQFTGKYGQPVIPPNVSGGFATKLQAQAAANKYARNPDQAGGVDAPGVAPSINAPNPISGLAAIGDLANKLTQPQLWIRVGEFLAGGVLLVIGLNALTKGPVRSATASTAKKGISIAKAIK